MPLTGEGKNIGLNAIFHTTNRFAGGLSLAAATAVEASTAGTQIKKTQSLKNGNLIYFSVLSGGTGLVALRPYYVVGENAAHFEVALSEGGAAVSFSAELKAASEYVVVTELSGGSYKRIETAYGAAAAGKVEDTTPHALKVPAGKTIGALADWEGESTGHMLALSVLTTPESYGKEGVYTIESSEADMNEASGTPAP
jgi:hypothetical protein